MVRLGHFVTARTAALGILAAVAIAAIVVIIASNSSTPTTAPPGPAATPITSAVPWTGRVIGVMAVPPTWNTLAAARLPFTIGYPPGWQVRRVDSSTTPGVILAEAARHRTLTISGRPLRTGTYARTALTPLAFTPVAGTRDPAIFIRSHPGMPTKSEVTNIVAFTQGGYLWTVRMVQRQDVHLIEGLHALQAMLATFHTA